MSDQSFSLPKLTVMERQSNTPNLLMLVDLDKTELDRVARLILGGIENIQGIYPLSPLQEGMLFHHLRDKQNDTYILSTLFELHSKHELEKLVSAAQFAVDRHDALRTAVLWEQLPKPMQVVSRTARIPIESITLEPSQSAVEQLKLRLRPAGVVFDLQRAPLMRLQVIEDSQGAGYYALLQVHHVICDHQSLATLISEISAGLDTLRAELPEPQSYCAFIKDMMAEAQSQASEAFFKSKLESVDEPTAPFGVFHAAPPRITEARLAFPLQLAHRVRATAKRANVSPARLFHAAWALVLARISGREDVVFGTVISADSRPKKLSDVRVGLFVNTLPIRVDIRDLTTELLVVKTSQELTELLGYVHTPLPVAQHCSRVDPALPLFSTLLNYRRGSTAIDRNLADPRVLARGEALTGYPIVIIVDDLRNGFTLTAQTHSDVDPNRLLGYVCTAMHSLVIALEDAPQAPALSLSILPVNERQQVLREFNATEAAYPQDKLIHQLFEEQVQRVPQALAVVCGRHHLTYAELNAKANQLAWHLREKNIGPDKLVGICVGRGLDMMVGLLGVLKAGGAYVSLDPNYPAERLQHILSDAAPGVVLTEECLRDRLPDTESEVVTLDGEWGEIAQQPCESLDIRSSGLRSDHLAYVIYTSGSTGQPKGVAIEHRNAVNLIYWAHSVAPRELLTRTLQSTSLNFDLSVYECFVPLAAGAGIHVVENAMELMNMPVDVTLINTVPSAIRRIIEAGLVPEATCGVNLAGEPLKKDLVDLIFKRSGVEYICNLYGPSETTTYSTWVSMCRQGGFIPTIGKPIANTQVYILDARGAPVPIGVAGEIFIGGAGVARGYLNRPQLTGERFIADAFATEPHARLYRTGDLGRWHSDGNIEYLGRNDHQVKVRGFRIELGEIESKLLEHSHVKEAAVLAREEDLDDKRLVAYVVGQEALQGDEALSPEGLRAHLKPLLPEYMLPAAFVVLERLPLTPNGKLDRNALPAPEFGSYVNRGYESPVGEIEELLVGIWQDLLRVGRIGRHDNFFELGGHSLLIVQMIERLRRVGLSAQVRVFFESPTLIELSRALMRSANSELVTPPNRIPPACEAITPEMLPLVQLEREHIRRIEECVPGGSANIKDIYPLTPAQEGILFHRLLDHHGGDIYVRTMLLSVDSKERLQALTAAVQNLIDRHDVLRTAVLWEQLPQPLQVVYRRASLPVREISLIDDYDPLEQLKQRIGPIKQSIDVRRAPLLQLEAASNPLGGQWYLLLRTHHLVTDNESMALLLSELRMYLQDATTHLTEPMPYRNHVARALSDALARDCEAFFLRKLSGLNGPTLPFGLLELSGRANVIDQAQQTLERQLSKRIRIQMRRLSVSAATFFHAAWSLLIAQTSGRDDVVFGTVLSGRVHAGAHEAFGMYVNTLPLRLRLQSITARELIDRTQQELVEILGNEQAPLVVAQRCGALNGVAPLFSSLLNYRHTAIDNQKPPDAGGVSVLAFEGGTNYPIALSVDDPGSGREQDDGFKLVVQTDGRVDPQRILRYMFKAMRSLVEALERSPQVPALSLSVLPENDLSELLSLANGVNTPYPEARLVHELFEEQVRRAPDTIAAVCETHQLTYAGLNAKANQLAHFLRQRGVGPDQRVGICAERGLEMMLGWLGILKAGGAYLPLDPNYPAERLQYMLADAAPKVLLTLRRHRAHMPLTDSEVISLDEQWKSITQHSCDDLSAKAAGLKSQHLAYVIYTSGSTGQPKGVMVEHRNVLGLAINDSFAPIGPEDCVSHCASPSFDATTWEVWAGLLNGARVLIVPQQVVLDPLAFNRTLIENSVTVAWLTVGLFNEYVDTLEGAFGGLRYLLVGGEALAPSVIARALSKGRPPQHLLNCYGPTETTTFASTFEIDSVAKGAASIPIGRPIGNCRVYVLNDRRTLVAQGVTGELYVGGSGVSRGYLNRKEMTDERFFPDPFSETPGARLYRTGDLGRWRADGVLEHLGRNDTQIKIRGFRIELGEIEAQLLLLNVKEAVVLARADVAGEKQLVAYVTPKDGELDISPEVLRTRLKAVFPDYMMPSAFIVLDRMPLTQNGKVDRRALPAPDPDDYVSHQYEPPQGEMEETLVGIWQELLRVKRVGRHDSFFELGGHSLLAMRLTSRLRESLGIEVVVGDIFESGTLEAFARRIGGATNDMHRDVAEMDDDEILAEINELKGKLSGTIS